MNMVVRKNSPPMRYRTIWISDFHLGTPRAQSDMLLDFLKSTESDYLYLVGDIIDNWSLKKTWYWAQAHNDVIQKILRKARKGTRVYYLPGNHDEQFRGFIGTRFGMISVKNDHVHKCADGKRYLVLHGDIFDGVVMHAKWLAMAGDGAYELAMSLNQTLNAIRRRLGLPYWSLSAALKHKVKRAVAFLSYFEEAMISLAERRGVDGVICGHVHTPEIRKIAGFTYFNDGDWVESCSALVEHMDGKMELLRWAEIYAKRAVREIEPCAS